MIYFLRIQVRVSTLQLTQFHYSALAPQDVILLFFKYSSIQLIHCPLYFEQ